MTTEGKTQQEIDESDDRCAKVRNAILKAIDRVNRLEEDLTDQEISTAVVSVILKIHGLGGEE